MAAVGCAKTRNKTCPGRADTAAPPFFANVVSMEAQ